MVDTFITYERDPGKKELVDNILCLKGTTHIPPVNLAKVAYETD